MPIAADVQLVTVPASGGTALTPEAAVDVLNAIMGGGAGASDAWLKREWQNALATLNVSTWTDGVPQSGSITWPDGGAGTYAALAIDSGHGKVTSLRLTHTLSGKSITITYQYDAANATYHNPNIVVA